MGARSLRRKLSPEDRYPGAFAKMPSVYGGLLCDWNWSWAIDVERDVPADAAYDPVRGFAVIPGSEGVPGKNSIQPYFPCI